MIHTRHIVSHRGMGGAVITEDDHGGMDYRGSLWYWGEVYFTGENVPERYWKLFFPPPKIYVGSSGIEHWVWDPISIPGTRCDVYSIMTPFQGNNIRRAVTWSWDYQHIWNHFKDIDLVKRDVMKTITVLRDQYDFLIPCPSCGRYGNEVNWIDPGFGAWTPMHPECFEKLKRRIDEPR